MAAKNGPRLPGMADGQIKELTELAVKYARTRDKRQTLTNEEVQLKGDLLKAMKKHKKTEYDYEDVHVEIVVEEETVKVKIRKPADE